MSTIDTLSQPESITDQKETFYNFDFNQQLPKRKLSFSNENNSIAIANITSEINKLLKLAPGWDGMRAHEITVKAVSQAIFIIFILKIVDSLLIPQFFPLPDGGIQLEWHVDNSDLEIEIEADGNLYILGNDGQGKMTFDQDFSLSDTYILNKIADEIEHLSSLIH